MTSRIAGALLVLCATTGAEAGPARRGQVVRVERRRAAVARGVHLCVQEQLRDHLLCLGPAPPRIGERIALLGLTSINTSAPDRSAVARVTRTERSSEDRCDTGMIHAVYVQTDPPGGSTEIRLGFTGLDLPPNSRLVPPGGDLQGKAAGYTPQLGIDTDGSDGAEIVLARKECQGPGRATEAECFAYLQADGGDWKILGEDMYTSCR